MTPTAPVTVVVPAYQAAPFLAVTLESLQAQTTVPSQVIVVDDGSTDDTAQIAERHGATVVRQQQRGPGAARNRGLALVETEFVAFCDADDWYTPDKLERSVEQLRELGAACTANDAWIVRDGRLIGRRNGSRLVPTVLTLEFLLRGNPIVCSSVVARKDAVVAAGGFDEDRQLIATEDYDLWLRMATREPIAYLPRPLTFYRDHTGSLSTNERFMRGVDHILARIAGEHVGEAHFQQLIRRRRADVRLDFAWDLFTAGRFDDARALLTEARSLARTWKGFKLGLRTLLRR